MKSVSVPISLIRIAALLLSIPLFLQIFNTAKSEGFSPSHITVTVEGQGPDVIMIPGLASSAEVWRGEVDRLKATYRVHLVQVSGFAGTPPRGNSQPPLLVPIRDEIVGYIRSQNLKRPTLIGHSMGGLLTMMIADSNASDIGNVMIVDSLPFFGVLTNPQATSESVAPMAAKYRDQILAQSQESYAAAQVRTMGLLIKSKGPEAQAALVASQTSDHNVVAHALYEDWTSDLRPRLAGLHMRVVVLYPYDATMGIPQTAVDALYTNAYASLPDKQIVRIDGSFHFIQIDQPDRFHEEVLKFLTNK